MGKRVAYPVEIKEKAIEMKLAGCTNKEILDKLNIKNVSQVKTWWRWYRNGETHRFHQQVGKQYSFGKGIGEQSETEQLKIKLRQKEQELEVLKKYKELERKWSPNSSCKW